MTLDPADATVEGTYLGVHLGRGVRVTHPDGEDHEFVAIGHMVPVPVDQTPGWVIEALHRSDDYEVKEASTNHGGSFST